MKLAVYFQNGQLRTDPEYLKLRSELLGAGCQLYETETVPQPDTDMLLSVGGDGTFLSASSLVAGTDIPVMGVNLGRMGFLSENRPANIASPLLRGQYTIESREMLEVEVADYDGIIEKPYALNEISVHRKGAAMLGIEAVVDGEKLPTYWADGILVATSSGSTAYSLSVGGPICTPDAKVLIVSPIAPHNLNLRPLIVPSTAKVSLSFRSRDEELMLTMDNRNYVIDRNCKINVRLAYFSLKRVRLEKSNFIEALQSKLFWGEDFRNESE